jgi:hypothetical protein
MAVLALIQLCGLGAFILRPWVLLTEGAKMCKKAGPGFGAGVLGALGAEYDTALMGAMRGFREGLELGGNLGVGYGVEVGS